MKAWGGGQIKRCHFAFDGKEATQFIDIDQ